MADAVAPGRLRGVPVPASTRADRRRQRAVGPVSDRGKAITAVGQYAKDDKQRSARRQGCRVVSAMFCFESRRPAGGLPGGLSDAARRSVVGPVARCCDAPRRAAPVHRLTAVRPSRWPENIAGRRSES